ncbi:MAG: class I SAM-dependent methyltransferase [Actinomycetota bacterium]
MVRRGYDRSARGYLAARRGNAGSPINEFLAEVVKAVPQGGAVLDLGCGAGDPVAVAFAERCVVTGVDISGAQLALARSRVPGATFIHADMATVAFPADAFDAVVAYFSIIHLPREAHADLFARIAAWLRPGGIFAGTLGHGDSPSDIAPDWYGAPMYWSHFDSPTNIRLVTQAGLIPEIAELRGVDETFLCMLARKPGG